MWRVRIDDHLNSKGVFELRLLKAGRRATLRLRHERSAPQAIVVELHPSVKHFPRCLEAYRKGGGSLSHKTH